MNKIFIIGNLTRDPELRSTASNVPYCNFTVAVSRRFSGSNGERITDFFNVTAWKTLAEICAKFLSKGKKVSVVGELQIRSYEDKNGVKRTAVDISADEVEFLTPIEQDKSSMPNNQYEPKQQNTNTQQSANTNTHNSYKPAQTDIYEFTEWEGELPF